jgi:phosphoribosylformimino-5-aminoimidazole carboxamide ribotide isomerase
MIIIPAIDIKSGKVVRLFKGDFSQFKIYSADPVKVAEKFYHQGVRRIHIVDLDAAREGKSGNLDTIKKIASKFKDIEIQVGGGIRSEAVIEDYLNSGIKYLVISTRAYLEPEWFISQLNKYKEKLILAIDVENGRLKLKGWEQELEADYLKYLREFKNVSLKTVVYTAISQDGTLEGPDIDNFSDFLTKVKDLNLEIIYSGGISSNKDIEELKKFIPYGLIGVIVGKAIYEGRIVLN